MKTMEEARERVSKTASAIAGAGKKAAYAAVGAPAVARKRLAKYSDRWRDTARQEFEAWVAEGERITEEVREGKLVEEIKEKVDFEQLQGRVEKLRDQLEEVLSNWRNTFKPEDKDQKAAPKSVKKPAAKKAPAKKAAEKAEETSEADA